MSLYIVTNESKRVPRTLGPVLGLIAPGATREFEGTEAEELARVIANPAIKGIVNVPRGLKVIFPDQAVAQAVDQLKETPRALRGMDLGAAVSAVEELSASGDVATLQKLQRYSNRTQLDTLIEARLEQLKPSRIPNEDLPSNSWKKDDISAWISLNKPEIELTGSETKNELLGLIG